MSDAEVIMKRRRRNAANSLKKNGGKAEKTT
jgi:hypothetical protein